VSISFEPQHLGLFYDASKFLRQLTRRSFLGSCGSQVAWAIL